jgi:hypothetical protein
MSEDDRVEQLERHVKLLSVELDNLFTKLVAINTRLAGHEERERQREARLMRGVR